MGYIRKTETPHKCATPEFDCRGTDIWQCDECKTVWWCKGWSMVIPGFNHPVWTKWKWYWRSYETYS